MLNTTNASVAVEYWRDRNKEVDFVVHHASRTLAIEVKSGRQTRGAPGLVEFKKQFPQAQTMVVGTGGIPLEEFLSTPADRYIVNGY